MPDKTDNSASASAVDPLLPAVKKLKEAERLRDDKNLPKAKQLCEDLVEAFPDYVGALHTLGLILADMDQYESAISVLSKAVMLCPMDWRILTAISGVNLRLGRQDAALIALEQARSLKGDDPNIIGTLAEIYRNAKEYELSARSFEDFIRDEPTMEEPKLLLADCYEHMGRLNDAATIYTSILDRDASNLAALTGLAQLPEVVTGFKDFHLIDDLKIESPRDEEKIRYTRALGFHREGKFDRAWEALIAANESKMVEMRPEWDEGVAYRQRVLDFARGLPAIEEARAFDRQGTRPISLFILGPSRSGKTTFEYLIGAIPGVKRGYENPIVENAVRRTMQLSGCITRTTINGMPQSLDGEFVNHYNGELEERAGGSTVFTNTHPGKIVEALRYVKAIPGSRFAFIKRDPYDLILSTLMKNYATGNSYAYHPKTIKEYIDWYHALIDICAEKAPTMCAIIDYQEFIGDPESSMTGVKRICELDASSHPLHTPGDDRGIARPYREFIDNALKA